MEACIRPAQDQASHHAEMKKRALKAPPMTEELLGINRCGGRENQLSLRIKDVVPSSITMLQWVTLLPRSILAAHTRLSKLLGKIEPEVGGV